MAQIPQRRVGCEVNCTTTKEWSEEDIVAIDCAVDILSRDLPSLAASIERLKSLRPHNTWKPSDRELGAILVAIGDERQKGSDVAKELRNIHQQLKKLREESYEQ